MICNGKSIYKWMVYNGQSFYKWMIHNGKTIYKRMIYNGQSFYKWMICKAKTIYKRMIYNGQSFYKWMICKAKTIYKRMIYNGQSFYKWMICKAKTIYKWMIYNGQSFYKWMICKAKSIYKRMIYNGQCFYKWMICKAKTIYKWMIWGSSPLKTPPVIIPSYEMVEQTQKALKQEKPTSSFLGSKLDHAQAAVVPTWWGLGFAKKNHLLPSAVLSIGKSIFFSPCPIARTLRTNRNLPANPGLQWLLHYHDPQQNGYTKKNLWPECKNHGVSTLN